MNFLVLPQRNYSSLENDFMEFFPLLIRFSGEWKNTRFS